jgi:hypothetical protein
MAASMNWSRLASSYRERLEEEAPLLHNNSYQIKEYYLDVDVPQETIQISLVTAEEGLYHHTITQLDLLVFVMHLLRVCVCLIVLPRLSFFLKKRDFYDLQPVFSICKRFATQND